MPFHVIYQTPRPRHLSRTLVRMLALAADNLTAPRRQPAMDRPFLAGVPVCGHADQEFRFLDRFRKPIVRCGPYRGSHDRIRALCE